VRKKQPGQFFSLIARLVDLGAEINGGKFEGGKFEARNSKQIAENSKFKTFWN
jgi:hypothetical protein